MKRLLSWTLTTALILAILLAACSPKSGSPVESPADASGKPTTRDRGAAKAAWEEKWDSTLAAAKKEGTVVIYGQVGPELREVLTSQVKKEFDLNVEFVVGKGAEVSTRFLAEWQAGIYNADILLWGASTHILIVKPRGILESIKPLLVLPETTDPGVWRDGKMPFIDKDNMMIPLVSGVNQMLLVNTDVIKPGQINAFRDLAHPQWKGKIVMFDPTMGGSGNTWVTLILTKIYGLVEGEKFLRQYVAQEPLITKDSRLQVEWLARGRYPVCVAVDGQAAYSMQKAGAPITRLKAEEGGLFTGGGSYMGLPSKRPHPNTAAVLVNWLLGPRGQLAFSTGWGAPASRSGIPAEGVSPLALPQPGEKLFQQDEEFVLMQDDAREIAKKLFAPLLK